MSTTAYAMGSSTTLTYSAFPDGNFSSVGNDTGTGGGSDSNFTGKSPEEIWFESHPLRQIAYWASFHRFWFLLAFGVPGNVASIYTIISMPTISSSKAHVAILALVDTLAIIVKMSFWEISAHRVHITSFGCSLLVFLQEFFSNYANWIVVIMTAERFLAVWFPLRVGRMYTRRKAFVVLGLFALLTSWVYLLMFWSFKEVHEDGFGYYCAQKAEYQDFIHNVFYWISSVYCCILPCIMVLVGNILIITNIKKARKAQRHLTNSFDQGGRKARDQKQITLMLIVVSVVFLVLNLPNAIFYIVKPHWTNERYSYGAVQYFFISRFVHILSDANHAVNFYLYFLSMSTFRRRFIDAVRCRSRRQGRPVNSSVYRTSQTYMHSVHHGDCRHDGNHTGYSAYKRSSANNSQHSLKSFTGNTNSRTNSTSGQYNLANSAV